MKRTGYSSREPGSIPRPHASPQAHSHLKFQFQGIRQLSSELALDTYTVCINTYRQNTHTNTILNFNFLKIPADDPEVSLRLDKVMGALSRELSMLGEKMFSVTGEPGS